MSASTQYITLEEIVSQSEVWQVVLDDASRNGQTYQGYFKSFGQEETIFIGCGTSFYLSMAAANVYSLVTQGRARASTASDVLFFPQAVFPKNGGGFMPVLISRSGETTEVVRAAERIRGLITGKMLAVSCRPESDLVRVCDFPMLVPEADEKSVVMTRSFTSMLLAIQLLAASKVSHSAFETELHQLPNLGQIIIERYRSLIEQILTDHQFTMFVYLGQGPYYGLACEGMLKIKEMSLSSSEAYHSLEFRHGPKSMADKNMLITFLMSERVRSEEIKLLREVKELGAFTLVICERTDSTIDELSDYVISLDSGLSDYARMVLYMPIVQLLGYYQAVKKGLDPDNPKNLSQVVTL